MADNSPRSRPTDSTPQYTVPPAKLVAGAERDVPVILADATGTHAVRHPAESWRPDANPLHRLINRLDVIAIAWNRYRQMSFSIVGLETPETVRTWQQMRDEFWEILRRVRDPGDTMPRDSFSRIANEAIARSPSIDEPLVNQLLAWLEIATFPNLPACYQKPERPRLNTVGAIETNQEQARFEREGEFQSRYAPIRRLLIRLLAKLGQTVPARITQRERLAYFPFAGESEFQEVAQPVLLAMLDEERIERVSDDSARATEPGVHDDDFDSLRTEVTALHAPGTSRKPDGETVAKMKASPELLKRIRQHGWGTDDKSLAQFLHSCLSAKTKIKRP